MENKTATSNMNNTSVFRFIFGSTLGIFLFFIKLPINGQSILPVDWICNIIKSLLVDFNLPLALLASVVTVYRLIKIKFWKGKPIEIFLNLLSFIAVALFLCDLFSILPQFFIDNNIYTKSLNTMVPFSLSIVTIMFLLPPLIGYGLPEALGVFARPFTRPLFKLPGKSAVIIVSAFMGNFTVGHLQANDLYVSGKLNHREAAIIATGFCTSSVGLVMSVCAAGGQMNRFSLLFLLIFVATLLITAITAHIYPLCKYPTTYYENIEPDIEETVKGNYFKIAYKTGVNACNSSKPFIRHCIEFGLKALPVVANIFVNGTACMIIFTLINQYTPIFTWVGMLFWPLLKLVGFEDISLVTSALGINAVDNVTSQLTLATAAGASNMTVLFGCGFGIMTVIFFGAFLASLYSTKINIKFIDLVMIWIERTALTVVIWGLIARFLA